MKKLNLKQKKQKHHFKFMILKVIGSGSTGNCYALCTETEILLIECGLRYSKIQEGINFEFEKIVGCLVTHEHKDHCFSAAILQRLGIKIYSSPGTCKEINCGIGITTTTQVGGFTVTPFPIVHDAVEPYGFYIVHPETGPITFITDSMYCKTTFPKLKHLFIEANYIEESLMENDEQVLRNRVRENHMSIDTCLNYAYLHKPTLENIVLLHLSERNSNEVEFKERMQKLIGCRVHLATKNNEIHL